MHRKKSSLLNKTANSVVDWVNSIKGTVKRIMRVCG